MAFLCPVRIRSQKHKKKKALDPITVVTSDPQVTQFPVGRITGSSSIETLVRVGLPTPTSTSSSTTPPPPNTSFVVLHDFNPCVDDELQVCRSDIVTLLYRENDWAYVVNESAGKEGFIPVSYLGDVIDREEPVGGEEGVVDKKEAFEKSPEPHPHIVLYTFHACNENDLTVHRGSMVTVLNKDDPEWFWVSCDDKEGFVPSAFVFPINYMKEESSKKPEKKSEGDLSKGTELIMLYDYRAQAPDDLSVKRGDWVYADLGNQIQEGWLWSYSPKARKYGFLPRAYARVPAMTSL